MTNLTTLVFIAIVTNWVSVGTFTDKQNQSFDVQEGRLQTNTVASVLWDEDTNSYSTYKGVPVVRGPIVISNRKFNQTNEFILKSVQGPVVAEKRVEITNVWITNISPSNYFWWYPNRLVTNREFVFTNGMIMNVKDLK